MSCLQIPHHKWTEPTNIIDKKETLSIIVGH